MRCPRILTFSFLIFTTSKIIGLQASSLPADAPPSGQPTFMLVPSNSTINPSNLAPPKPPVPPRPRPKPPAIVRVNGWAYRGCWTDDPRDRTLRGKRWKGNVTPEKCAEVCKGYAFFAVEYSDECYCGNTLSSRSRRVSDDVCSLVCMGNFESICGGANSLSLYEADKSNVAVS